MQDRKLSTLFGFFVSLAFLLDASNAFCQEPSEQPAFDSASAYEQRMKYMTKHALSFTGTRESEDGESIGAIRPLKAPLLRWTNVYSGIKDGILAGWVDESGRPMAFAQICLIPKSEDRWCIEMQSLSSESFELDAEFNGPWRPSSPGVEWKRVASVWERTLKPAKKDALRLHQMKEFARRIRCNDDFELEENSLRILPKHVLRYSDPKRGILDGATFAMVHGTDPELVIMVELRKSEGDKPDEYYFALAPMTSFELNVTFEGKEIWHKPLMTSNLDTDIFWQRQLADSAPPQPGFFQRLLGL